MSHIESTRLEVDFSRSTLKGVYFDPKNGKPWDQTFVSTCHCHIQCGHVP